MESLTMGKNKQMFTMQMKTKQKIAKRKQKGRKQ